MPLNYRLCLTANDYLPAIPEVAQLFSAVFLRQFPAKLWDRLYLSNPYGPPYAVLGYNADQLVSHHALIPQILTKNGGEPLRYFHSISTMVHPAFRGMGIF